MAWPTITVEFDMFNDPLAALADSVGVWNDRSSDALSITIKRGRRDELGRVEAGTAIVVMDNTERLYNPQGVIQTDPILTGIRPMRKIRITATYSAVTYYLFTGFIESWQPDYISARDSTVTLRCVDAFKYFALKKLNGPYTDENTKWSIDTWLTNMDWPAADRALHTGQSQIQAGTFVNTPALTHFRNVESVENGLFFVDGQGLPTFHNRYFRLTNSLTSSATFDDDEATTTPFLHFTALYDDTYVWNEARITRTGGTEQVASNTTSQDAYLTRTYTATLPLISDNEAQSMANYFVSRYATPAFRFTTVTVDGKMSDSLWPHMLGLEFSDRVTVSSGVYDPLANSPPFDSPYEQECYIEGVTHVIDVHATGRWTTTFQLSPAGGLTYWVLGHATYGKLGTTTILGY